MSTILVVDDSAVDRQWVGDLLEIELSVKVTYAEDGLAALKSLETNVVDLVLTDLQMPNMNGLQLVEEVRRRHPLVPVMLMTAHGSEDVALEALKKGAAGYVPKRKLAEDLVETVENLLGLTATGREESRLLDFLQNTESQFELENDLSIIPPLIGYLEKGLKRMDLCDATGMIRVAVAVREALVNAIEHGNLEVDSKLRESDGAEYEELVKARRCSEPYSARRVFLTAIESRAQVIYVIRDEGQGFDPSILPDPTDPDNLERASGRGLLLIRTFMDQVDFGDEGREITMVLYRDKDHGKSRSL